MANTLKKNLMNLGATFALVTSAVGINDNKIMAQGPGSGPGFTPEVPAKTEVAAADTVPNPKTTTPDSVEQSADLKAIIATEGGQCVAIIVSRGSLDADKSFEYIDNFVKTKLLPDLKMPIKVFVDDEGGGTGSAFGWAAGGHIFSFYLTAKELHALQNEIKKAYVEFLPDQSSTKLMPSEP